MSAPGFGFSAGDFIAAATLIAKVTKALKDTGGARAEYRTLVDELDRLQKLLTILQNTSPPSSSNGPTAAASDANSDLGAVIEEQIRATLSEVTEFLKLLSKFDASLGAGSKSGWRRGIPRKAQWAIHYASEVEKMREKLQMQLAIISTVLQTNLCSLVKSASDQTAKTPPVGRQEVESLLRGEMSTLATQISPRLAHMEEQRQVLIQNDRDLLHSASNLRLEYRSHAEDIEDRIDRAMSEIIQHMEDVSKNNDRRIESLSLRSSHSTELTRPREVEDDSESMPNTTAKGSKEIPRVHELEQEGVRRLLLALLRAFVAEMGQLLLSLTNKMPHLMPLLYSIHFTLLREPMLAHADCIMFEDMMGQGVTLDYRYYRDWRTFENFLLKRFSSGPGRRHVAQHMYRIMGNGTVVQSSEWSQTVQPGSRVTMFGLIPSWKITGKSCPKPGCRGEGSRRANTSLFECRQCSVVYAGDKGTQGFVEGELELDNSTRSNGGSESRLDEDNEETLFRRVRVTWHSQDPWNYVKWEDDQESTYAELTVENLAAFNRLNSSGWYRYSRPEGDVLARRGGRRSKSRDKLWRKLWR